LLPPPLSAWTSSRELPVPPRETFRDWWQREGVHDTGSVRAGLAEPASRRTATAEPGASHPGPTESGAAG
jgi:L-lactate dehydrogenase complex protein LldF